MLASFCLVSLVGVISFVKQNPLQKDISAAETEYDMKNFANYYDDGRPIGWGTWLDWSAKTQYDNHDKFVISDLDGLKAFAAIINWGEGGVNFAGKEIRLSKDIDCDGETITIGYHYSGENRYFNQGIFDGNNHTISNFTLNPENYNGAPKSYEGADSFGFFTRLELGTTIQNLKLKNFSFVIGHATSVVGQITGGIVGFLNGGTINNCIVEDFSLEQSYIPSINEQYYYHDNRMSVGGIFGVGYGTVKNCLVKNISLYGEFKNAAGIGPADFPYMIPYERDMTFNIEVYYPEGSSKSTIQSCVVQNITSLPYKDEWMNDEYNYGVENKYDVALLEYFGGIAWSDDTQQYEILVAEYNHSCLSTCQNSAGAPGRTGTLSTSSCSSVGGTSGTTWYYGGTNYNSGYPYLRQFIPDWYEVQLKVNNSSMGEIESNSGESIIYIPSTDLLISNKIYSFNNTLESINETVTQNTFNIYGEIITAKAKTGYELINCTLSYKATKVTSGGGSDGEVAIKALQYKLNYWVIQANFDIKKLTVTFASTTGDITINPSVKQLTVNYGSTLTCELSNNDKTLTYSYNGQSVLYQASQYYILSNGSNVLTNITSNKTITPQLIFYACIVTMTEQDDSNIATMSITGDDYEKINDGIFIVEYGTTIEFEAKPLGVGLFEYTYTFKYSNETISTISYTITNNQYAMSSEISNGERKWHTQIGIDNKTQDEIKKDVYGMTKTISPEFIKKHYDGNLA